MDWIDPIIPTQLLLATFTLARSGEQSNRDRPIFATGRHQLGDTITKRRRDRFERFKIIFPILLAGWIPSILTLIVSYTILRDTLESRILRDRQTLIQLVGHLVAHDLSRSSSVIEYYQTLPELVENLSAPNPQLCSTMAQLGVLFAPADRRNVHHRSERRLDRVDSRRLQR